MLDVLRLGGMVVALGVLHTILGAIDEVWQRLTKLKGDSFNGGLWDICMVLGFLPVMILRRRLVTTEIRRRAGKSSIIAALVHSEARPGMF